MIDIKELEEMGKKAGFSHVALLKRDTIELMPEVREMCKKTPAICMTGDGAVRRAAEIWKNAGKKSKDTEKAS